MPSPDAVQDRFTGCLLGGAVGDALGAPVEFLFRDAILARYGPDGITGSPGRITDDTQMTLFTAEGLLRGWVRGRHKGITRYEGTTAEAYLRWLATQGIRHPDLDPSGWLYAQRALHSRRAPGNTCLSALQGMPWAGAPARNDSKGCGGVMRVAPVGLFAWRLGMPPEETFTLARDLAALTHGHPTGALTAGVLAVLVQGLTDGAGLEEPLAAAKGILRAQDGHEETLRALELAEGLPPAESVPAALGEGWVAEEALAIALWCAGHAGSFREGVVRAVNHDGDSDSTGAIAGNLLGAMHGAGAIPPEWLAGLELRDVIAEVAADLYAYRDWDIGEYSTNRELDERILEKYPGA